jgi:alanine racemase
MTFGSRPTHALIDLDRLCANFLAIREFVGVDLRYMAVIKADAYGHGAVECGSALRTAGVQWLGVATPEEALELRSAGISCPILCLGGFWTGQEDQLIRHRVTPVIFELDQAVRLNDRARQAGITFSVHVKVDTGMGRLGFAWPSGAAIAAEFRKFENLTIEGLMTHFASADDLSQSDFTALQVTRFGDFVSAFRSAGYDPEFIDLSNSPGAIVNGAHGGNLVRLGGILYGLAGDILPAGIDRPELRPVMSVRSCISHLKTVPAGQTIGYGRTYTTSRDSLIAAVPIGYYDGYRRGLSNRAQMIVRGKAVPVVGRISMDWTTIDVSDVPGVLLGDEVTVIGAEGDVVIRAEDLAKTLGTISYEITCGITRRVPRHFVGENTDSRVPVER